MFLLPSFEEKVAHVRAVNTVVADDASLAILVLGAVDAGRDLHMALQAKRIDARGEQHARIDGGVRGVANRASLHPHGFVLKDEGAALVGVTLEADEVLIGRRPYLAIAECAVRVVAIGALDQALIDTMAEGLLEIGALFRMTRVTQRGLLADQQIFRLGVMNRVATGATGAVLVVGGTHEFALFRIGFVAGQAALGDVSTLGADESEDLGLVAATFHVGRARTMTGFATVSAVGHLGFLRGHPVRRSLELLVEFVVASLADGGPDIFARSCSRLCGRLRLGLLGS